MTSLKNDEPKELKDILLNRKRFLIPYSISYIGAIFCKKAADNVIGECNHDEYAAPRQSTDSQGKSAYLSPNP